MGKPCGTSERVFIEEEVFTEMGSSMKRESLEEEFLDKCFGICFTKFRSYD